MRRPQPLPKLPERSADQLRRYVQTRERSERQAWDADEQYAKDSRGNIVVTIGTGDTKLFHTKGASPEGFLSVLPRADARIWCTAFDATSITLRASASVVTKVKVL